MPLPYTLPFYLGGPSTYTLSAADPLGGSDGTLARIGDHANQGVDLLIQQYRDKPRIEAWLRSYLDRYQNAENAILAIYENAYSLTSGKGDALDLVGRIVRETRNGRSDGNYRLALRVRILINRSNGTIPELIKIARLFEDMDSEAGAACRIQSLQPARLEVRVVRTPVNDAAEVDKRLRQAKASGVTLSTLVHPGGPTGSFRFCRAADYAQKSTTEGFSNVAATVSGGTFAHVLT